jgi:hypothetical protein
MPANTPVLNANAEPGLPPFASSLDLSGCFSSLSVFLFRKLLFLYWVIYVVTGLDRPVNTPEATTTRIIPIKKRNDPI